MTQLADIQEFIDRSRGLGNPSSLQTLLVDITHEMGFDYVALLHHVNLGSISPRLTHMKEGRMVAVIDYPPAWVENYIERNLVVDDPVHLASHRTNVGFRWDEMSKLIDVTAAHRQIRDDTVKAGIDQGFTVPANVPGEARGSCSFAARVGRQIATKNLAMAQLIGSFAFQAARSIVIAAARNRPKELRAHLTPRQVECILWIARGKTDWEISRILAMSEKTVKWHVEEAREKLNVSKRMQLVLQAMHDGYFGVREVFSH